MLFKWIRLLAFALGMVLVCDSANVNVAGTDIVTILSEPVALSAPEELEDTEEVSGDLTGEPEPSGNPDTSGDTDPSGDPEPSGDPDPNAQSGQGNDQSGNTTGGEQGGTEGGSGTGDTTGATTGQEGTGTEGGSGSGSESNTGEGTTPGDSADPADPDDDDVILGLNENETQIEDGDISLDSASLGYTGAVQWPTVKYKGAELPKDYYTIVEKDGKTPQELGDYNAVITIKEKSFERAFTIVKGTPTLEGLQPPTVTAVYDAIVISDTETICKYQVWDAEQNAPVGPFDGETVYNEVSAKGKEIIKTGLTNGKTYEIYYILKESDNYIESEPRLATSVTINTACDCKPLELIDIDYVKESIAVKKDQSFELALDSTATEGATSITDLSTVIEKETFDFYIREVKDVSGTQVKSAWASASLKGRPAAPTVKITKATGKSTKDGKITSTTKGLEYKLNTAKNYSELTTTTKVAPGTYLVRLAATESSFAGIDTEAKVGYSNAAAKASTRPTAKTGLTYNGSEQTLINGGSSKEGTMKYSLTKDGSYSTSIPTAKKAGAYTVWWKIEGDKDHKDSTPSALVARIAKKQLTVSGTLTAEKNYDGNTTATVDWSKVTLNGVISGEDVTVTGTATFEDANPGTGKKIRVSGMKLLGSGKDNYTLKSTSVAGTGTIKGKATSTTKKTKTTKKKTTKKAAVKEPEEDEEPMVVEESPEDIRARRELKERQIDSRQYDLGQPNITMGRIELGNNSAVKMESKYLSLSDMSDTEREVLEASINDFKINMPNLKVLDYFDISIFQEDEEDWKQVDTIEKPVQLVIDIPEQYRNEEGSFYVLRIHEGQPMLLNDSDRDPDTVTISSNQFSTYVLLHDDSVPKAGDGAENDPYIILVIPKTVMWAMTSTLIVIGLCMILRRRVKIK